MLNLKDPLQATSINEPSTMSVTSKRLNTMSSFGPASLTDMSSKPVKGTHEGSETPTLSQTTIKQKKRISHAGASIKTKS